MAKRPNAVKARRDAPTRKSKSARRRNAPSRGGGSTRVLPIVLSTAMLLCIGVIAYFGIRTMVNSDFFSVTRVEISGIERAPRETIERIVNAEAAENSAWTADLATVKERIEKLTFVRSASVSRWLPNSIIVSIKEHEPAAVVKMKKGEFLVTKDAQLLAEATAPEPGLPVAMIGWDEEKSQAADKENLERVKLYAKMIDDWKIHGVLERVSLVDLSNVRVPRALAEEGGMTVSLEVGKESFGENLERGLKAIAGKATEFEGVELVGSTLNLKPRKTAAK